MSASIQNVAVLGAGDMGHGIAEVALLAGFSVTLRDIKDEYVQRGAQPYRRQPHYFCAQGNIPSLRHH